MRKLMKAVCWLIFLVFIGLSSFANWEHGTNDIASFMLAVVPVGFAASIFILEGIVAVGKATRWTYAGIIFVAAAAGVASYLGLYGMARDSDIPIVQAALLPLAFDGVVAVASMGIRAFSLAIVANVASGQPDVAIVANVASGQPDSSLDNTVWPDDGHGHEPADCPDTLATTPVTADMFAPLDKVVTADTLASWDAQLANWDMAVDLAGQDVATEAEAFLRRPAPAVPVVSGVPAEARDLLTAWDSSILTGPEVDALLAGHFGKTARTARRWRAVVRPSSA